MTRESAKRVGVKWKVTHMTFTQEIPVSQVISCSYNPVSFVPELDQNNVNLVDQDKMLRA